MGSKTRRLRLKVRPVYFSIPPRFSMQRPGLIRSLLLQGLLRRFADEDLYRAFGTPPRCFDGARTHDFKGQRSCPVCGFTPALAYPGHARDARKEGTDHV